MRINRLRHRDRRRPLAQTLGVLACSVLSIGLLAACDDDEDVSNGTVLVGEDFPGDALDAACARLEGAAGDDREAIAAALLDELIEAGGEEPAVTTLEMAVIDACPEWAGPVNAAIEARS